MASSGPTVSRLTQPFIALPISKMSTLQMIVIGGKCAFQIGSLYQLKNQDMTAFVTAYFPCRELIRERGWGWWWLLLKKEHSERPEPGGKCDCKAPSIQ